MDRKTRIAELIAQKSAEAAVPVPDNRIPFVFNGIQVGHLLRQDALFLIRRFRFFEIREDALLFSAQDSAQATRRLAAVSQIFKAERKVFAWRDELLPVVPMHDLGRACAMGAIERAMCRPFAFSTFAVHLNPFTEDGRLWVAQRSFKKAIGPGYWDNCAAGMVPLNESFPSAMTREAYEEAGIEPGSIAFYFCSRHLISRPVHEGWMRENTILFNAEVSDSFQPHNVDGEVEKFELMTPDTILDRMEAGLFTFESSLSILVGLAAKEGMPTELDLY